MSERGPYTGTTRKLLVAVDIGTTFTVVSFSILEPGEKPQISDIVRWPKQANPGARIPSAIWYDEQGVPQAHGAETEDEDVMDNAESKGWHKAEWWKLRLRPKHLNLIQDLFLPKLPPSVTVDKIFEHHLVYIKEQLEAYISAQYGDGADIWKKLYPSMEVVLTTPNGWELAQQQRMRAAAQKAALVQGPDSAARVRFVSEAEAAVLYSIESGCTGEWLAPGAELILCNCGGSTIDIASYKINESRPIRMEETIAASCYLAGAIFVTQACENYLNEHLRGSEWDNPETIEHAKQHFERNGKRKFDSTKSHVWIELIGYKSDANLGVQRGKLNLSGTVVASFFTRALEQIKEGIDLACRRSDHKAKKVILVGGLANSPYVYKELQAWGDRMKISISRPDAPTVKAASSGALLWYLNNHVSIRVNKVHFGSDVNITWIPGDPETAGPPRSQDSAGELKVGGGWHEIVGKDMRLEKGFEYTEEFLWMMPPNKKNQQCVCDIWVNRWDQTPRFIFSTDGETRNPGFELLCTVKADLRKPFNAAPLRTGNGRDRYKEVQFTLCLSFGETELSAQLSWKEKGQIKYHGTQCRIFGARKGAEDDTSDRSSSDPEDGFEDGFEQ